MQRRLLFVDDEDSIRISLAAILEKHGFEVSVAATVGEALKKIMSEKFDILLSDLNIGNAGDGLTVVSAMRRTQPEAVTMILTGYPAFETALEAIRQQVDEYIVKPANIPALVSAIESKLSVPPRQRPLPPTKRVAMLLQENLERIQDLWLSAREKDRALSQLRSSKEERGQYVHQVMEEVIRAAQTYSGEQTAERHDCTGQSAPAIFANLEGHTPNTMLSEFCLLRRVIALVVQDNLLAVNLSYLIPDLDRVNESLDEQAQAALSALSDQIDSRLK